MTISEQSHLPPRPPAETVRYTPPPSPNQGVLQPRDLAGRAPTKSRSPVFPQAVPLKLPSQPPSPASSSHQKTPMSHPPSPGAAAQWFHQGAFASTFRELTPPPPLERPPNSLRTPSGGSEGRGLGNYLDESSFGGIPRSRAPSGDHNLPADMQHRHRDPQQRQRGDSSSAGSFSSDGQQVRESQPRDVSPRQRLDMSGSESSEGRGGLGTIGMVLFIISLVANAALILWCLGVWGQSTGAPASLHEAAAFRDTDGDGIPDHHDFCPGSKSIAPTGWVSGRATDFDGDGCEDFSEDLDRDNDGVKDIYDRCPNTPQRYGFVSNQVTDFDGDGCADGVEDKDDDGDGVKNADDDCPRSKLGEASDAQGCSSQQQQMRAQGIDLLHEVHEAPLWMQQHQQKQIQTQQAATPPPPPQDKDEEDVWNEYVWGWVMEFRGAWAEIIVGAVLSTGMQKVGEAAEGVRSRLPSNIVVDGNMPMASETLRRVTSSQSQRQGWLW
eukprot:CAMPEP_0178441088 /NCGR_PEP_ID=MMETSP0689_2-20121128/37265_1 /TAXON_ID=160604 /ORGANISM="Amphidinium massartii, Strain CS-259" /LENGTH=495 /DNA_ID=CAMNT_0020064185 /DNA_START=235 /DNA_END=1719 /DNA_ORIENTATION=-